MSDEVLWATEERFWLEGVSAYENLHPACLMAFPGAGIMKAEQILESLGDTPRWDSVEMTARAIGRAAPDMAVLAYRAEARRKCPEPYVVFCTSTYRCFDGVWKLTQHQQTPAR